MLLKVEKSWSFPDAKMFVREFQAEDKFEEITSIGFEEWNLTYHIKGGMGQKEIIERILDDLDGNYYVYTYSTSGLCNSELHGKSWGKTTKFRILKFEGRN